MRPLSAAIPITPVPPIVIHTGPPIGAIQHILAIRGISAIALLIGFKRPVHGRPTIPIGLARPIRSIRGLETAQPCQ